MSRLNRILFLFNNWPLPRLNKRIKVAQNLFEVHLVYWDRCRGRDWRPSFVPGVQVVPLRVKAPLGQTLQRIWPLCRFFRRSWRELTRIEPDLIHACQLDMLIIAWFYKLKQPRVRIVYEVADLARPNSFFLWLERQLEPMVEQLILTSEAHYRGYYRQVFDREKTLVIPNCPERSVFAGFAPKPATPELVIGWIGSLRYFEQLQMLIESATAVGGIRVLIAGAGPDAAKVRALTAGRAAVDFYGAYNYDADIRRLYGEVDCLYSVYDADRLNVRLALPNRLYEAIHCGLPLIVARATALGQFVVRRRIGFAVGHRDQAGLVALLTQLTNDRRLLAACSDNCRRLREEYVVENFNGQLLGVYQKLALPDATTERQCRCE